jgi:hypothetical protein
VLKRARNAPKTASQDRKLQQCYSPEKKKEKGKKEEEKSTLER